MIPNNEYRDTPVEGVEIRGNATLFLLVRLNWQPEKLPPLLDRIRIQGRSHFCRDCKREGQECAHAAAATNALTATVTHLGMKTVPHFARPKFRHMIIGLF